MGYGPRIHQQDPKPTQVLQHVATGLLLQTLAFCFTNPFPVRESAAEQHRRWLLQRSPTDPRREGGVILMQNQFTP